MKGNLIFAFFFSLFLAFYFDRYLFFHQGYLLFFLGPLFVFLVFSPIFFGVALILDVWIKKLSKKAYKKRIKYFIVAGTFLAIYFFTIKPLVIYGNLVRAGKWETFLPQWDPHLKYCYIQQTSLLKGLAILFTGAWMLMKFKNIKEERAKEGCV